MTLKPVMNADEVIAYLREVFPESNHYGFMVEALSEGKVTVGMKVQDHHLRPGGTVSGPTMFALADVAAYLVVLAHIGKVALAVTTNLNINFLAKPQPGSLLAEAKLMKLGKRLAICVIEVRSSVDDALVAHATATYSIPPRP